MGVKNLPFAEMKWKLAGGAIIIGGSLAWIGADRSVSSMFEGLQPRLENILSQSLGHPIRLGNYQGLRPWGLAIGPTKVLRGLRDDSSATFDRLTISFAPIASLMPTLYLTMPVSSHQQENLKND